MEREDHKMGGSRNKDRVIVIPPGGTDLSKVTWTDQGKAKAEKEKAVLKEIERKQYKEKEKEMQEFKVPGNNVPDWANTVKGKDKTEPDFMKGEKEKTFTKKESWISDAGIDPDKSKKKTKPDWMTETNEASVDEDSIAPDLSSEFDDLSPEQEVVKDVLTAEPEEDNDLEEELNAEIEDSKKEVEASLDEEEGAEETSEPQEEAEDDVKATYEDAEVDPDGVVAAKIDEAENSLDKLLAEAGDSSEDEEISLQAEDLEAIKELSRLLADTLDGEYLLDNYPKQANRILISRDCNERAIIYSSSVMGDKDLTADDVVKMSIIINYYLTDIVVVADEDE